MPKRFSLPSALICIFRLVDVQSGVHRLCPIISTRFNRRYRQYLQGMNRRDNVKAGLPHPMTVSGVEQPGRGEQVCCDSFGVTAFLSNHISK